jgi:hypothetical protein
LDRDEVTCHGLHLNSKGKEQIARTIGQHLVDLLKRQAKNVLMLPCIDENKDSSSQLQADVSGGVRSSKLTVKAELQCTYKTIINNEFIKKNKYP